MKPLREILRKETDIFHKRMTSKLDLTRPTLTLSDYRIILQKLYGLLNPLEYLITQRSDWDVPALELKQRLKTHLITKDLIVLGVDPQHVHSLPTCRALPSISHFAEMLGCMYVLEGSTLGGQSLSQHFLVQFQINSEAGCSYFSSYGALIFEMWSRFVEFLNNYGSKNASAVSKVTDGAVETFHSFEKWLT